MSEEIYKEKYLRSIADFENYQKRAQKEIEAAKQIGREEMFKELLPLIDNIKLTIKNINQTKSINTIYLALNMILEQFSSLLNKFNITEIKTVGNKLDPSKHNAIQTINIDYELSGIIEEIKSGYICDGKLIRAADVIVNENN
jgi:molecular chaperone GrpE